MPVGHRDRLEGSATVARFYVRTSIRLFQSPILFPVPFSLSSGTPLATWRIVRPARRRSRGGAVCSGAARCVLARERAPCGSGRRAADALPFPVRSAPRPERSERGTGNGKRAATKGQGDGGTVGRRGADARGRSAPVRTRYASTAPGGPPLAWCVLIEGRRVCGATQRVCGAAQAVCRAARAARVARDRNRVAGARPRLHPLDPSPLPDHRRRPCRLARELLSQHVQQRRHVEQSLRQPPVQRLWVGQARRAGAFAEERLDALQVGE